MPSLTPRVSCTISGKQRYQWWQRSADRLLMHTACCRLASCLPFRRSIASTIDLPPALMVIECETPDEAVTCFPTVSCQPLTPYWFGRPTYPSGSSPQFSPQHIRNSQVRLCESLRQTGHGAAAAHATPGILARAPSDWLAPLERPGFVLVDLVGHGARSSFGNLVT